MRVVASIPCPLCGGRNVEALTPWAWRCGSCGGRFSSLEPRIDEGTSVVIDEQTREAGLRPIRDAGYARLLAAVDRHLPLDGASVLDVGCGYGWFLQAAAAAGAKARGIEPDRAVAEVPRGEGLDVTVGYFPRDLEPDARFDLITFNDVFEHLPDLPGVLAAVRAHLRPEGLLAINIPTSEGAGYRIAETAQRLGVTQPFDRLWQREYPSPHLWYFDERSLAGLVRANGFDVVMSTRLPSVQRQGLRERIAADPRSTLMSRAALVGVWLAAPVLSRPRLSDAMLVLFRPSRES
jgi:2-polyprenyl-3-methyl-5-hydroxy-6-metoxy-1,4-benzoquinol methylase